MTGRSGMVWNPLHWLALATWLAVGLLGWFTLLQGTTRYAAGGLWLLFGGVLLWMARKGTYGPRYFALQTVLVMSLLLLAPVWSPFPILFFLLSAQASLVFPSRQAWKWVALFALLTAGVFGFRVQGGSGLAATAVFAVGYFFFATFAQALRREQEARSQAQQLLHELRTAHERLRAYARQSAALAVARERNRMAREMHDTVGHHLTVAAVQLEAAQALLRQDPERAAQMLANAREQVRQGLQALRRTVAALRPPVEDLKTALEERVRHFVRATGLQVDMEMPEDLSRLPPPHRFLLYRAVQEGLTNVLRHAHARRVWIRLRIEDDRVVLTLEDDGRGPPATLPASRGMGLRGMAEQAAQLGGHARLEAREPGGARLCLELPLTPPLAEETAIPDEMRPATQEPPEVVS